MIKNFNAIVVFGCLIFLLGCGKSEKSSDSYAQRLDSDGVNSVVKNNVPVIQDFNVSYSSDSQMVHIMYDVYDDEEKQVEVKVFYSLDGGMSYQSFDAVGKGDIGPAVTTGADMKIQLPVALGDAKKIRVALMASDHNRLSFKELVDEVDTVSLKKYVRQIYGVRSFLTDSIHLSRTKNMIKDSLEGYGYEVRTQQVFYEGHKGENIIVRKPGYNSKAQKLILCAHYDSTSDSPGADDNASGVAGILEISRILADIPTENTIEIVAFDMEEVGLVGSRAYVSELKKAGEKILGAINLDMIGYMSSEKNSQKLPKELALAMPRVKREVEKNDYVGDFVVCIASEKSKSLRDDFMAGNEHFVKDRKVISILTPGRSELFPDLRYGDHAAFWDEGYPAIFIGDGADTRNPNYHTEKDEIQLLHYGFMQDAVQATLALVLMKGNALHATTVWKDIELN